MVQQASSPVAGATTAASPATSAVSTAPPLEYAHQILASLPPVNFAFAYGSAVVPQRHVSDSSHRMVDLVVAIDGDARQWHADNLERNSSHYSLPMNMLGPAAIAATQRSSFGARVYYNTFLPTLPHHRPFKYGVVDLSDLIHDLCHWQSLYLSGRLHKPVHVLSAPPDTQVPHFAQNSSEKCDSEISHSNDGNRVTSSSSASKHSASPSLSDALTRNLNAAAAAALLCLPERFTEYQFYRTAAALSYTRDVRTILPFEVPSKADDIVAANLSAFRKLYAKTAAFQPSANLIHQPNRSDDDNVDAPVPLLQRDISSTAQARLLDFLPQSTRQRIATALFPNITARAFQQCPAATETLNPTDSIDDRDVAVAAEDPSRLGRAVAGAVGGIVAQSSLAQSMKGVATAGLSTSARYVTAKLRKTIHAAARHRNAVRRVVR